jgi:hypothetical protein
MLYPTQFIKRRIKIDNYVQGNGNYFAIWGRDRGLFQDSSMELFSED